MLNEMKNKYKLAMSNIAWSKEQNNTVFKHLNEKGFSAIEIAPTIFMEKPYEKKEEFLEIKEDIYKKYGLTICSMQSIWFGVKGNIFNIEEQKELIDYTKSAIDFASLIECGNLVFGCPKNRIKGENDNIDIVIPFFKELGDYAYSKGTCLSIEPNPTIYGTNFLNYTKEAIEFIKKVDSKGLKLNLDLGTIIENKEDVDIVRKNIEVINHIHISEPNLLVIENRKLHKDLVAILKQSNYDKYVSIEMKKTENIEDVFKTIDYISNIFNS